MFGDAAVFFGLWLRKPLQIAAVCPSGVEVAAAMARLADRGRAGPLLELGAGSGSITRGLIEHGWPADRIIACEREPRLVAILRRQFPAIRTICVDATALEPELNRLSVEQLAVVVSSLPIKWFAFEEQRAVLRACLARLRRDGLFLQLTNAFSSPLPARSLGVHGWEAARVWRNIPPAQIWAYRKARLEPHRGMP